MDGPQPAAADNEAWVKRDSQLQDAIAACMAAKGFKYVPQAADNIGLGSVGRGQIFLMVPVPYLDPDRAVVERNGYGLYDPRASTQPVDENEVYRQSLSPAEADAYDRALQGEHINDPVPSTDGGCASEAMAKYPEPTTSVDDRQTAWQAENGDLLQAIWSEFFMESFLTEPRVVALNQQWESCMNGKGYVFDVASGQGPWAGVVLAERTRPDGTVGPPNIGVAINQIPPDESSLMGTEPERKVALADYDCRAATNYLPSLFAIRTQMDSEFIAAHGAALLRLKNSQ